MKKMSLSLFLVIGMSYAPAKANAGGMSGGGFNSAQHNITVQTTEDGLLVFAETEIETDSFIYIGSYTNNNDQLVEIYQDPESKDLTLVYEKN